ncbi:Thioredoxin-related protein [Catalinimonas alkaloidigena]|uniref:Thioredoxin-related protein n=1 Tax=Catalinimonas alkaloidigena TaxID=1075417 RepID=A0A1G9T307_9BACT|nr:DUF255 domain-containing protein [Catalinimonas alkaloidigena]SDM42099.1 Thioredoxin-related protein [Catalinimonas alkaloidigena]
MIHTLTQKLAFLFVVLSGMLASAFTFSDPAATAPAEQINWLTFEEAMALNQKNPKKVFLDVYTDWCGWCKRMDQTTFSDPEVVKYMNENFYAVKFDAEGKDPIQFKGQTFKFVPSGRNGYHELAAALLNGKLSFPTTVYLDEEMNLIQPVPGYMKAPEFLKVLSYFGSDHFKDTPWEKYEKSYTVPTP